MSDYDPWVAQQVHNQAHKLLGEFFDRFAMLEWDLDEVLLAFFRPDGHREMDFRTILLGRIGTRDKIKALENVLKMAEIESDLPSSLQRAHFMRNVLAHSAPGTSERTFSEGMVFYGSIMQGTLELVGVTPTDFEKWIATLEQMHRELHELTPRLRAVSERPQPPPPVIDLSAALDESADCDGEPWD